MLDTLVFRNAGSAEGFLFIASEVTSSADLAILFMLNSTIQTNWLPIIATISQWLAWSAFKSVSGWGIIFSFFSFGRKIVMYFEIVMTPRINSKNSITLLGSMQAFSVFITKSRFWSMKITVSLPRSTYSIATIHFQEIMYTKRIRSICSKGIGIFRSFVKICDAGPNPKRLRNSKNFHSDWKVTYFLLFLWSWMLK